MTTLEAIEVQIQGLTASFRVPMAVSGVLPALPVPGYSHLLGFLSCCADRIVEPKETRIGFEYTIAGHGMDKERITRWDFNDGKPKLNSRGSAVRNKEFHYKIILKLYITQVDLENDLKHPKGIISLGQSQDLVTILQIRKVNLDQKGEGRIGGTLIPFSFDQKSWPNGHIFMLPEYYIYPMVVGKLRTIGKMTRFIATENSGRTQYLKHPDLYQIQGDTDQERAIYLHSFT